MYIPPTKTKNTSLIKECYLLISYSTSDGLSNHGSGFMPTALTAKH